MSVIEDILKFNKSFVANRGYEQYKTNKYPNKKVAILSCMDTRLTSLLPAALNLKNDDMKIIKNAGAVVSHPFGSVMRSLMVAIYDLNVKDIMVIGHSDCGMQGQNPNALIEKMINRGIEKEKIKMINYCGVDIKNWLKGFNNVETSVKKTVKTIKEHPLIPKDVNVYGFIMNPETGALTQVN